MQSVSSRIWTRVAVFISYDDNNYTMGLTYPTCLVCYIWIVCEMGGEWPYRHCYVGCYSSICLKQHVVLCSSYLAFSQCISYASRWTIIFLNKPSLEYMTDVKCLIWKIFSNWIFFFFPLDTIVMSVHFEMECY